MKRKAPPREVPFAETLEEASIDSLIFVDERGQVGSVRRQRNRRALYWVGASALLGGYTGLFWILGGPFGLVVGGLLTLTLTRQLPASRALQRAMVYVATRRLDEAERLLRRLNRSRWTSAWIKGHAAHSLARIALIRGRYEEALGFQEWVLRLFSNSRRLRARRRMIEYERVITLVNLGRLAEARRRFDSLPRALEGDYLRLRRTSTELYLALGEGEHRFDPAFLREQADIALAIPVACTPLMLLAWAQERAGQPKAAAQLLAVARDRPGADAVQQIYPRLAAWMDSRRSSDLQDTPSR